MQVLLVIDPTKTETGISAMVWSRQDDDPRLLESRQFKGDAALKVWLAGIATRFGRSNITVNWTDSLRADDRLATIVRQSLDPSAFA